MEGDSKKSLRERECRFCSSDAETRAEKQNPQSFFLRFDGAGYILEKKQK
jgi:hypothetical protein